MNDQQPSRMDQMFDLLVGEIEERMRARMGLSATVEPPLPEAPIPSVEPLTEPVEPVEASSLGAEPPPFEAPIPPVESQAEPAEPVEANALPGGEAKWQPREPAVSPNTVRLMRRLALGLLVAIVLINIPFNRHGTTLATAMPDSAAVVIREGLVVKEGDDEEIYVYQSGQFRWISSLDAFEHFGFTWGDVHVVEDGFLDQFEIGMPLHVLLKCPQSPHIYRLERGEKRWIRDIATFDAEGHVWEDVRLVGCNYLRDLPNGETIPPGSGPPPQP
ncbi:MAG: hypothetical protein SWK90_18500 [Chloroflexota bacterium]|nr:hypothetical protein [Chloroflexota bacterium]